MPWGVCRKRYWRQTRVCSSWILSAKSTVGRSHHIRVEVVSGQVAIEDSELVLPLGSLIDGARSDMEEVLLQSF